ncbi:MAG: DUF3368 domain-containing protein [Saprospiraceae bacterium]
MTIVSDTSPVSNLLRIGQLRLLKLVFQNIVIPGKVMDELLVLRQRGIDLAELVNAAWIEVKNPTQTDFLAGLKLELDEGEAEAIALAKELGADTLIIDELQGRAVAVREGLQIIGVLGILLEAKQSGHLPEIRPMLDLLISKAKFRLNPALYHRVLGLAGELPHN